MQLQTNNNSCILTYCGCMPLFYKAVSFRLQKEFFMVIDFHTHIFPDKIAPKAIPNLARTSGQTPMYDGTRAGLLSSMERSGIDLSIILPVVTAPHQFDSILRFACSINEDYESGSDKRLLSFAGIHPDAEDIDSQLKLIAHEGFRGIKIHPNYQGRLFTDIRYLRLIDKASELGLIIITHTGFDPYTPGEKYCTPDMILSVINELHPPKLVLAHFGSNQNYEESLEKLAGQNVWLDTAFSLATMPEEIAVQLIHKHGADRVLYGSDGPWTDQRAGVDRLLTLPGLTSKECNLILFKNAQALLSL